jgi:hypothetical protein
MTWRAALVRISTYDVDELRKRLAVILDRRADLEMKLVMLAAEAEAEMRHADLDPELRVYRAGFLAGVKVRRERIDAEIRRPRRPRPGVREPEEVRTGRRNGPPRRPQDRRPPGDRRDGRTGSALQPPVRCSLPSGPERQ